VESFNIAIYLDEKYPAPQYPAIFPPGTRSIQNLLVNQYFPIIVGSIGPVIGPKVPLILDSRSIEYLQRTRGERLKPLSDGEVAQKWQEVFEQFAAMSKSLEINGGGEPFFTGDRVSFFDFALGGLFHMVQKVDSARLREILEWQDGKWDIYWKGVQKIENNSSEVIR
jgi:glutathione S-transferase